MTLTAVYMKVPEGYVAFVEELPGANTQGETLEEAIAMAKDAIRLHVETLIAYGEPDPKESA